MKFSIVSYFDPKNTEIIRTIQKNISELTDSRGALESWEPHITVGAGVDIPEDKLNFFIKELALVAASHKEFSLELKNFGFMDNWPHGKQEGYTPYVVYIDVVLNKELLGLVGDIEEKVTDNYDLFYGQLKPYQPHVTIAFKDLDETGFEKTKKMLLEEDFTANVTIDHFSIVSEQDDGKWAEYKKFSLI